MNPFPWRRHFWLAGLVLAPLLFGSVTAEGQAVVGLVFGAGLMAVAFERGGGVQPLTPLWLRGMAAAALLLPLLPLPVSLVAWCSPETAALARQFPVEPGAVPVWITPSLSPAGTVQRLWELALVGAAFALARHSATEPRFGRHLVWTISLALALLAASDVWYRATGRVSLVGLWTPSWGTGAGTFANRNHFANWCVVGIVLCAGWILRSVQPLHGARSGRSPSIRAHSTQAWVVTTAILFALIMTVLSGSRGGLIALVTGAAVWLALLWRRTHRRGRWLWLGAAGVVAGSLVLAFGNTLLARLLAAPEDLASRYPKLGIWQDTLWIGAEFPVWGVGWGAFAAAFGHLKSFGGDATFWHAENDYAQWFMEGGAVGVLVLGVAVLACLRLPVKHAWARQDRVAEPELLFGGLAALGAFAAHATFEFVFQIPSTAILAAVILGYLVGAVENEERPKVPPPPAKRRVVWNLAGAVIVLAVASLQLAAWLSWDTGHRALRSGSGERAVSAMERSLGLWPWDAGRQLALTRAQVLRLGELDREAQPTAVTAIRQRLTAALRRDPLNWELRLDRAWLALAFAKDPATVADEAWEVVRLNPLQAEIPLRFARFFTTRDAALAWRFLEATPVRDAGDLREVLEAAWALRRDGASLWVLTPPTAEGLLTLGSFATDKNLRPLAVQAYQQLRGEVDPLLLAGRFLEAGRPDLANELASDVAPSPTQQLLLARASLAMGRPHEAIRHAESLWESGGGAAFVRHPFPVTRPLQQLQEAVRANAQDGSAARQLGEAVFALPVELRDLGLLRQLAGRFPHEYRLRWIVFRTELERGDPAAAARTAVGLAERWQAGH